MDSLARHRRLRNLSAISLDLPAILGVGLIHENPELRQSVESKGMYGIHWKEMIKAFEIAMRTNLPPNVDHIAVGIQPGPFGRAIKAADAHIPWKEEPRLNWLEFATKEQAGSDGTKSGNANNSLENIKTTIRQAQDKAKAVDIIISHIAGRLARLLMTDAQSIQPTQKSLASHGLDSMIGVEFRNWIFREFGVDLPFQQLLAGNLTISELAHSLYERLG